MKAFLEPILLWISDLVTTLAICALNRIPSFKAKEKGFFYHLKAVDHHNETPELECPSPAPHHTEIQYMHLSERLEGYEAQ